MLVKTLLIALVSFIGFLECGVGNSMIQRPIVMGPQMAQRLPLHWHCPLQRWLC